MCGCVFERGYGEGKKTNITDAATGPRLRYVKELDESILVSKKSGGVKKSIRRVVFGEKWVAARQTEK